MTQAHASRLDSDTSAPLSLSDERAAIGQLLSTKAYDALGGRLSAARRRWPDDLRLKLDEVSWLEASGEEAAAEARLQDIRAAHRDNPWPAVRLVELYLRQRRGEAARELFRDAVWRGAGPESTRTGLLSRTGATLADPEARRAFLESLLHGSADDRFPLLKLAALAFRQRDRARSEALFDQAEALGPLTEESRLIKLELLFSGTRFEAAYALARELQERNPERVEFARRSIQGAIFTHRTEEMVDLLGAALRRWPEDWLLLFRYNRTPLAGAVDRSLFALLSKHAEARTADGRWMFQYAIACLRHAETARASAILTSLAPAGAFSDMAAALAATLASQPAAVWDNPRRVDNSCDADVQVIRSPGAVATVVLFSSVVGGLGYLPFGHADGLLRQRPVHVVYLRDLNHRSFTSGVRSLGPDQAAMLAGLGRITGELGVPVVTMGSSIAGVAAIRAATMMQAHAAISFAGPINLGVDAADDAPPTANAAADGTRASLFAAFTKADLGIVELIRAAPATTIHQSFGADFAPDVAAAHLLDGLANARLYPEPDCADHFVIEHAITRGSFFTLLDAAIQAGPGAP